jgi:hypothetical protein
MAVRKSVLSSFKHLQPRDSLLARRRKVPRRGRLEVFNLLRPPDALYLGVKEPERDTYLSPLSMPLFYIFFLSLLFLYFSEFSLPAHHFYTFRTDAPLGVYLIYLSCFLRDLVSTFRDNL